MAAVELRNTREKLAFADCSTSNIPYRYDLGVGRDTGISYFVDNSPTQGFLSSQDGSPTDHQCLNIGKTEATVGGNCGSDIFSHSLNLPVLVLQLTLDEILLLIMHRNAVEKK